MVNKVEYITPTAIFRGKKTIRPCQAIHNVFIIILQMFWTWTDRGYT